MFTFTWQIVNFDMCLRKVGSFFDSPTFDIATMKNIKGFIRLYPCGEFSDAQITCYFHIANGTIPVDSNANLSYISCCSTEKNKYAERNVGKIENRSLFITEKRHVLYEAKSSFLPDGTLTVKLEIAEKNFNSIQPMNCFGKTTVLVRRVKIECPMHWKLFFGADDWNSAVESSKIIVYERQTQESSYKFKISFRFEYSMKQMGQFMAEMHKLTENTEPIQAMLDLFIQHNSTAEFVTSGELSLHNLGDVLQLPFNLSEDQIKSLQNIHSSLYCVVKISDGSVLSTLELNDLMGKKKFDELKKFPIQILESIHIDNQFSDVVIQVGRDQYAANKCILAAASPVFKAMLESDMQESKTNTINIEDIPSSAIKEMMIFLYSGEIETCDFDSVQNLYSTADKYQILLLKQNCSSLLLDTMSVENAICLLELAHSHSDEIMEGKVRNFIFSNHINIINSPGWKVFMKRRLEMASDIMFQIFTRI